MPSRRLLLTAALLLAAGRTALPAAHADTPGRHPFYLHALGDLRAARWLLRHREEHPQVREAIRRIEVTIDELKAASWDDHKTLEEHPPIDVPPDRHAVLHRARELLQSARHDIAEPEDNPRALDLQSHALRHVDDAIHDVDRAINAA
jgi:hypothetical protein